MIYLLNPYEYLLRTEYICWIEFPGSIRLTIMPAKKIIKKHKNVSKATTFWSNSAIEMSH